MRDKVYVYIVKPGEELWDITHLTSEELISNFSDERITVRLLYDEEIFNDLINNPRMLIVSRKKLGPNYDQHFSWNIYESSFYEFNSDVYPYGPYEIMTGEKKTAINIYGYINVAFSGLVGTGSYVFKPARKNIYSHACNKHITIIGFSQSGKKIGKVMNWSIVPSGSHPWDVILEFIDEPYRARVWTNVGQYTDIPIPNTNQIHSTALQVDISAQKIRLMIYYNETVFDSGWVSSTPFYLSEGCFYYLRLYPEGLGIKRVAVLGPNTLPFDNGYFPLYLVAGRMPDGSEPKWGTYDPDIFFYVVYPKWVRRIEFESGKKADIIEFTARGLLDYMKEQFYDYTLVDAERFSKHTLNNAYWRVVDIHIPKPTPRIIEGYENLDPNTHFTREEMPLAKAPRSFENEYSAENEFPLLVLHGESILTAKTYRTGQQFWMKFKLYRPDGTVYESPYERWDGVNFIEDIRATYYLGLPGTVNVYVGILLTIGSKKQFWVLKIENLNLRTAPLWSIIGGPTSSKQFVYEVDFGAIITKCPKFASSINYDFSILYTKMSGDLEWHEYRRVAFDTTSEKFKENVIASREIVLNGDCDYCCSHWDLQYFHVNYSSEYWTSTKEINLMKLTSKCTAYNILNVAIQSKLPKDKFYTIAASEQFVWLTAGKILLQIKDESSCSNKDNVTYKLYIVDEELKDIQIYGNYLLAFSDNKIYKADISTLISEHENSFDTHVLPAKTYEFQSISNGFYRFLPYPKFPFSTKDMKVWDKTKKFWVIWDRDTLTLTDHYEDIETPKSIMQKLPDIEEKAKRKLYLFPPSLIVGVPEYPTDADTYINDITGNDIVIDPDDVVEVNEFARHRIASFWFRYFILGDLENTFNDESVTIDTEDWYAKELATRLENFIGTTKGIELLIIGIRTDLRRGVKFTFRDREWLVEEVKYYLAQGNTRVKAKEIKAFQTTSDEQGGKQ